MKQGLVESGPLGNRPFGSAIETALTLARRNPIQTALIAAAAGWLLHRVADERARGYRRHRRMRRAEAIPVLNTGQARIYDPDASPRHPMQDTLASRREMSARI
jgi:hypothetical protein